MVQRYLGGDRSAGDELARKFSSLVHSIVRRVLGPHRSAHHDDACQAVFLRIFANLDRWEHRCPFCKWLAVVAARRAIDVTRMPEHEQPIAEVEQLPDTRSRAELDDETMEHIEEIVGKFPEQWRRVWRLWTEGVTREEMARAAGKSVRTVQYWLAEMLEQIRERLRDR